MYLLVVSIYNIYTLVLYSILVLYITMDMFSCVYI
jgi:hypothetical protein